MRTSSGGVGEFKRRTSSGGRGKEVEETDSFKMRTSSGGGEFKKRTSSGGRGKEVEDAGKKWRRRILLRCGEVVEEAENSRGGQVVEEAENSRSGQVVEDAEKKWRTRERSGGDGKEVEETDSF